MEANAATSYKYDVAFSFHSKDEHIARLVSDKLQERFKTFFYADRQSELAGTDGEQSFSAAFNKDSRIVVVFYRKEWGTTAFTRIEETAIKNRAYDVGYDFSLFIPTETPPSMPAWLPRTRLYFGLERFGIDGAAGAIESKIEADGGIPQTESVVARADRLARTLALASAKKEFRSSERGVATALEAFQVLLEIINSKAIELSAMSSLGSKIKFAQYGYLRVINGLGPWMIIGWNSKFANVLDESGLSIDIYDKAPRLPGIDAFSGAKRIRSLIFDYELHHTNSHGYIERSGSKQQYSADKLADHLLRLYIEATEALKSGQ